MTDILIVKITQFSLDYLFLLVQSLTPYFLCLCLSWRSPWQLSPGTRTPRTQPGTSSGWSHHCRDGPQWHRRDQGRRPEVRGGAGGGQDEEDAPAQVRPGHQEVWRYWRETEGETNFQCSETSQINTTDNVEGLVNCVTSSVLYHPSCQINN